jgi:hypothetical protein
MRALSGTMIATNMFRKTFTLISRSFTNYYHSKISINGGGPQKLDNVLSYKSDSAG